MTGTLLLDRTAWDLVLDAGGNIAKATEPYAIAQDVATAVRTFAGDCWYDQAQGLPYLDIILGQLPPAALMRQLVVDAALAVPNVARAELVTYTFTDRALTGQIKIIDTDGVESGVTF